MKQLRMIGLGFCLLLASLVAVANRSMVVFSIDPIAPAAEGLSVNMPLYGVIFAAMFAGILLGGFTVWNGQRKSRAQTILPPSAPPGIEGPPL
ncbi:MAG: hypothetical protein ACOY2B_12900 [Pseudomonadota bacterium]